MHAEGKLEAGSPSVNLLLYINALPLYVEEQQLVYLYYWKYLSTGKLTLCLKQLSILHLAMRPFTHISLITYYCTVPMDIVLLVSAYYSTHSCANLPVRQYIL
jgi:hypothetical protein